MLKKFHEKDLDEIRISGEDIFDGVLLHVKKDKVALPNSAVAYREYIVHPGAVAIVPVLNDGSVVMVKQCRYPLNTVMWEVPAGKLDRKGEDWEECARRELSEETGYEAKLWRYLGSVATSPGFTDEIIHLYSASDLVFNAQHPDEDEFISVKNFNPDEIKDMLYRGELFDAKSICALSLAKII